MILKNQLKKIAEYIDEMTGLHIAQDELDAQAWVVFTDHIERDLVQLALFRALIRVMSQLGPESGMLKMPSSVDLNPSDFSVKILLTAANVNEVFKLPNIAHMRGCCEHQASLKLTFSTFLYFVGIAACRLEGFDSTKMKVFRCSQ